MSGHGGARSGAGAPKGGVSQLRRIMSTAINQGLERAGRSKGLTGTGEEVAQAAASHIISDMIIAGNGADVLKLAAAVDHNKGADNTGESSAVLAALKAKPGRRIGILSAQEQYQQVENETISSTYDERTIDIESTAQENSSFFNPEQPFFSPQNILSFEGDAPAPPTPPSPPSFNSLGVGGKNFENSENSDYEVDN